MWLQSGWYNFKETIMNRDEFVNKVNSDLGIEISILLAIASFILQNCILNKNRVNNPTLVDKIRLKMTIRKFTKKKNKDIYESFLKHGKELSESDLKNMGARSE